MNFTRARFDDQSNMLLIFSDNQDLITFFLDEVNEGNLPEFIRNVWERKAEYLQN